MANGGGDGGEEWIVCTEPLTQSQLAQNVDICPTLSLSKYIHYFIFSSIEKKKQNKLFEKENPVDFITHHNQPLRYVTGWH